tara:strand:+ start:787 stop:1065 length:279 start_codon:yes stop_codon:yes gene_type:complete
MPLASSLISIFKISGKKNLMVNNAKGPPSKIPKVPVKNIIKAFGPNLIISFKSTLIVNRTKEQGSRYLEATKYKFELSELIIPVVLRNDGKK